MGGSTLTDEKEHHARQLRDANEKCVAANALLEVRVIRARGDGMSWQLIADAIGVARQSAAERFTRLPELAHE